VNAGTTRRLQTAIFAVAVTSARSTAQTSVPVPPTSKYVDPSSHRQRYVTVRPGVRVHVLDWGGSGRALLLVPGYGLNAHIYDDFAPKLTTRFHVVAVTLRGWLPSDAPPTGYTYNTAAADIIAVIDSLHLGRTVLVGHSMGGSVVTGAAIRYPDHVRAVIYLDGALQTVARDSVFNRRPFTRPLQPPPADTSDTTLAGGVAAWRVYARHYFYGTWTPALEAEMWAHYFGSTDSTRSRRDSLTAHYGVEDPADTRQDDFSQVAQPALSICAATTTAYLYPWLTPDSTRWTTAQAYDEGVLLPFQRRECATFARTAPRGRAVTLDSGHYIFITREPDVVHLVREFVDGLDY
jgi:pimeloyl-ACP methyl ester carboxylesterase